jgi:thioredoxin 1
MLKVNSANFEQEVLNAGVPVLIDFYADWCMPCKMFGPVFESTAEEFEDKVKFVKINIDESPDLAQKYFVMSIPTLKLVNGEELKGSYVGAMPQDDLEDWVNDRI